MPNGHFLDGYTKSITATSTSMASSTTAQMTTGWLTRASLALPARRPDAAALGVRR